MMGAGYRAGSNSLLDTNVAKNLCENLQIRKNDNEYYKLSEESIGFGWACACCCWANGNWSVAPAI